MARLHVKAYAGTGTLTTLNMVSESGNTLDLSTLIDPVVTVTVPHPTKGEPPIIIDSSTADVTFDGSILDIKFGMLDLPTDPGKPTYYFPRISYRHNGNVQDVVVVGPNYTTEILLGAYS